MHNLRHGPPSAPRISMYFLIRASGTQLSGGLPNRERWFHLRAGSFPSEIAERLSQRVDVFSVAVNKIHPDIQCIFHPTFETKIIIKHKWDHTCAGIIIVHTRLATRGRLVCPQKTVSSRKGRLPQAAARCRRAVFGSCLLRMNNPN